MTGDIGGMLEDCGALEAKIWKGSMEDGMMSVPNAAMERSLVTDKVQ